MKVLFDLSGLTYLASRKNDSIENHIAANSFDGLNSLSIWVTSQSVQDVCQWILNRYSRQAALRFMNDFLDKCTVIPVRKAIISDALKASSGEFAANINIHMAEQFELDYILTNSPETYPHSTIPVILPKDLAFNLACFKSERITQVPFMDLKAQYGQIYTEIDERFFKIMISSQFILGPNVIEFEERFAQLQQIPYCVGVSSGTAALHIALMALGIGHGDYVMLPVNTFMATAEAVSLVGGIPIFVDCDEYYNLDVEKAHAVIKARIADNLEPPKALIAVHLYGQPANMAQISNLAQQYDLMVLEDACQAHMAGIDGELVGRFSQFGVFSFYPGKNLGAFGEAGALVTRDEKLFKKAKMLRQHGEIKRFRHDVVGHNYRMNAFQGAVLATKSKYLPEWTLKRKAVAYRYHELLADVDEIRLPKERKEVDCVYHLYVIQSQRRDELKDFLAENGVQTGIHYPKMLHQQPAYEHLGYHPGSFPVAEAAALSILSLPMYPELRDHQLVYVQDKIKDFYSKDR